MPMFMPTQTFLMATELNACCLLPKGRWILIARDITRQFICRIVVLSKCEGCCRSQKSVSKFYSNNKNRLRLEQVLEQAGWDLGPQ